MQYAIFGAMLSFLGSPSAEPSPALPAPASPAATDPSGTSGGYLQRFLGCQLSPTRKPNPELHSLAEDKAGDEETMEEAGTG